MAPPALRTMTPGPGVAQVWPWCGPGVAQVWPRDLPCHFWRVHADKGAHPLWPLGRDWGFQTAAARASQLWRPQVWAEGVGTSVSGESPSPGPRWLLPGVCSPDGRGQGTLWSLYFKGPLTTSSPLKASPPNTTPLEARNLHLNLGGHTLQSVAEPHPPGQREVGAPSAGIRGAGGTVQNEGGGAWPWGSPVPSVPDFEAVSGGGQPPEDR